MKKRWKSFLSILLIVTLIMPDLLNGFNSIYAGTQDGGGATTVVTKTLTDVADGFKRVRMSIETPVEGYSKGDNLDATFGMNVTLDANYLYEVYGDFSTDAGFPEFQDSEHKTESVADFNNRIDTYFHNNEDMPVLSYEFLIGEDFKAGDLIIGKVIDICEEDGKKIGEATFSEKDGSLYVNVTYENQIYNRLDAKLGFASNIKINEESLRDEPVFVVWSNDRFITATREEIDNAEVVDKVEDTITKIGPDSVNGTTIEYEIEVSGEKLNGYTIEDVLPTITGKLDVDGQQFLDVISVKVDGNEVTGNITEDGKFRYTFPTDGNTISNSVVTIKVSLTDEQKIALSDLVYDSNSKASISVSNVAKLYSDITSDPVSTSDVVNTEMKYNLIDKEAIQDNLNGNRFAWNISINSSYNNYGIAGAYLLDAIDTTAQSYEAESGLMVTEGTSIKKLPLEYLGEVTGDYGTNIYDSLTKMDDVNEFLSDNGWSVSKDKAYYFTYKNQELMIVPFLDYVNKDISITYYTNLNEDNNINSVDNTAKLVWKYGEGKGPHGIEDFQYTVNKSIAIENGLGYKEGVSYDEQTQILKWKIGVNYYQNDLSNVIVNDLLDDGILKLLDDNSIEYTIWDREKRTIIENQR